MEAQRTIQGARANSQQPVPIQMEMLLSDPTFYEGSITMLFSPFLIDEIPDGQWQTLQDKLGRIVREIIAKRKVPKFPAIRTSHN